MPSRFAGAPPVAKKHPRSFRFSEEAERILDELEERLSSTRTAIIELALRQLYDREIRRKRPPEKSGNSA